VAQLPLTSQPSLEVDPSLNIDFTFQLIRDRQTDQVDLEVHAESRFAQSQLQTELLAGSHWKTFATNTTSAALDDIATRAFLSLRTLIESGPQDAALLKILNLQTPPWSENVAVKMTDTDRASAVKVLKSFGGILYNELFDNNNPELTTLVGKIESLAPPGRPLRVALVSNGLVCPWSIMRNPLAQGDVDQFWGFKYELSIIPITIQGRAAGRPNRPMPAKDVLYAATPNDASKGSIGWLAAQQFANLSAARPNSVVDARKRTELIDALKAHHETVRLIVTFIHGADGTILSGNSQNPVITRQASGATLMFRLNDPNEFVTPLELKKLKVDLQIAGDLFNARPVVILNACESGSAGFGVATTGGAAIGFPFTLLALGASGVVATDAPVWGVFAMRFGTRLVDALVRGDALPKAVRDTRVSILSTDNNPLGLLYSFYGPPNATYFKP
jgi:hypothetical protein